MAARTSGITSRTPPEMPPADLRATLARLGLTQSGAARLLGVRVTTVHRWASGDSDVPPPVTRLLWAMGRDPTLIPALRGTWPAEARTAPLAGFPPPPALP
jgi:DNA-binding transcriptional regulator YiaG